MGDGDVWEHLGHQLTARPAHHGVGSGDDEVVSPIDVGLERAPHALRHMALIDVAPQVPLAQVRIVLEPGKPFVVRADHHVGEPQPDDRRPVPPVHLARHLLAENLRQRIARLRANVRLIDGRVIGWGIERQPERRLARCPHDARQAKMTRRGEDRVRARDVRAEHLIRSGVRRRRDRRKVDDRLDSGSV